MDQLEAPLSCTAHHRQQRVSEGASKHMFNLHQDAHPQHKLLENGHRLHPGRCQLAHRLCLLRDGLSLSVKLPVLQPQRPLQRKESRIRDSQIQSWLALRCISIGCDKSFTCISQRSMNCDTKGPLWVVNNKP